jgi:hypothetical protein
MESLTLIALMEPALEANVERDASKPGPSDPGDPGPLTR